MEINKIYICGLPGCGKSLLWELIDRHPNVVVNTHHNFGISHRYEHFMAHVNAGQYLYKKWLSIPKYKSEYLLRIEESKNSLKYIALGDFLQYLINHNPCFRDIFQAHFTKQALLHRGSSSSILYNIDLSFDMFMSELGRLVTKISNSNCKIETLDNLLFLSYLASVNLSNNYDRNSDYFALAGNDSIEQITNLFKYYNNFKIIYIERDFITHIYTLAKLKSLAKKTDKENENNVIYDIMLRRLKYYKQTRINYINILNDYFKYDDRIIKVKFEDLKDNTSKTMNKIYQFLKLDPDMETKNSLLTGASLANPEERNPYDIYDTKQINHLKKMFDSKTNIFQYRILNLARRYKSKVIQLINNKLLLNN